MAAKANTTEFTDSTENIYRDSPQKTQSTQRIFVGTDGSPSLFILEEKKTKTTEKTEKNS